MRHRSIGSGDPGRGARAAWIAVGCGLALGAGHLLMGYAYRSAGPSIPTPHLWIAGIVSALVASAVALAAVRYALRSLGEQRDLTTRLLDAVPEALILLDRTGTIVAANETTAERFGTTRDRLLGSHIAEHLPPDVLEERRRRYDEAIASGLPRRFEDVRDGRVLENYLRPIRDREGAVRYVAVFSVDITQRRMAEERLRRSEQRLELALRGADISLWEWDAADGSVRVDKKWAELFGYDTQSAPPHVEGMFALAHPDDRARIEDAMEEYLAGKTPFFEAEFRFRDSGGRWHRILARGRATSWGADGLPRKVFGTQLDVTALREAEIERDRLFRVSMDLLAVSDLEGRLRQVNPAWTATLGWTAEELLHRIPVEFVHRDDRETFTLAMTDLLLGSHVSFPESRFRCKVGDYRWLTWSAFPQVGEGLVLSIARDVTERRQAEEALRDAHRRTTDIIEFLPDATFVVDQDRNVVAWNRAMEEMTGVSKDQVLGHGPSAYQVAFYGERRPLLIDLVWEGTAEDETLYAYVERVGRRIYAELYASSLFAGHGAHVWAVACPLYGRKGELIGAIESIRDVSSRKQAQSAMVESEQRFRLFAENARDIIFRYRLGAESGFEYLSPAVKEITGYAPEDFYHDRDLVDRIVYQEDIDLFRTSLENPATVTGPITLRCMRKDGKLIWTEHRLTPVYDEGGTLAAIEGIVRDVTDRRLAEEESRMRQEQLVQADKMASLGILVSGVAHEINNPNFVIHSGATTLARFWDDLRTGLDRRYAREGDFQVGNLRYSELRADLPELTKAIVSSADRIRIIVQELRDFARQTGSEKLDRVNINSVVESAVTLVSHMIRRATDRFRVEYAEDVPEFTGNYRRLEQVAINLLQNACQALPDKSRALRVRTRFRANAGVVELEVEDEGVGIEPEHLAHVFDPFFTTKRAMGGTGLGLSISKTIAEEHGGELVCRSQLRRGTTMLLVLPVDRSAS